MWPNCNARTMAVVAARLQNCNDLSFVAPMDKRPMIFRKVQHSVWSIRPLSSESAGSLQKLKRQEYFEELGLGPGSSREDVRIRYLKLAKKYHPDALGSPSDEEKFHRVDTAYRELLKMFKADEEDRACEGEYGPDANSGNDAGEEEEDSFDIRHKAPQHRLAFLLAPKCWDFLPQGDNKCWDCPGPLIVNSAGLRHFCFMQAIFEQ